MALNGLPVNLEVGLTGVNSASRTLDNLTNQRRVVQLSARLDTRSILSAQKALGQISNNASEFEKSMQAANARVLAFGSAVGVIEGMRRSFVALIKTTVDVENALVKIASISQNELNKAGISIEQYGSKLFKVARETGQSFDTVGKAALEFARQGLKPIETLERTRDALILTRLSGLDAVASVEALTAAYNTFKGEVSGTNEILQKLVAVDNASAASVGDLAEGLQRAGFIAKDSGQNINELIATIAVLQESTARGGAVVGNAFKTILTRAQSLENLKLFESLGIDTTVEGKIKPVITLLQELSNVINDPSFTQNKTPILSQLAGNFQINQLSAFLNIVKDIGGQGSRYTEIVKLGTNATNEATQQNKKYGETLAASLNTATVSVEEFLNTLGRVGIKDPFAGLIEKVSSFFNFIQGRVDSEGLGGDIARGLVKGIGGVLFSNTGLLLVASALVKIGYDFAKFAKDAAVGFLDFNRSGKEQERIQASISNILATERGILDGISNTEAGRVILAQRVADIYKQQLSSALAISQLSQGAAAQLYNQGARIKGGTITGIRSANGFDPLVSAEMRDVKRGVGGASPNSKIVVMPNFPFGGGKKGLMVANSSEKAYRAGDGYGIMNPNQMRGSKRAAGGFFKPSSIAAVTRSGNTADTSKIEIALSQLAKSSDVAQIFTSDLVKKVKESISFLDLNDRSIKELTDAFISQTRQTRESILLAEKENAARKQNELYRKQEIKSRLDAGKSGNSLTFLNSSREESEKYQGIQGNPLALSRANTSFSNREITNQLGRYEPIRNSGLTGSDALTKAVQIGVERAAQSNNPRGLSNAPSLVSARDKYAQAGVDLERLSSEVRAFNNYKANPTAAFGGGARIASQQGGSSIVPVSPEEIEKTKKTFSDSLGKLFAFGIAAEGLSAAFGDAKSELARFSEFATKATLGFLAISEFSKFGGKSIKDFIPTFGEGKSSLARGFAAGRTGGDLGDLASSRSARFSRGAGALAGGAASLGKGLLGALPVIGQVAIGLGILSELLKAFKPDIFDGVSEAFGGLTKAAKEAEENFTQFSETLFDEKGKFQPKTQDTLRRDIQGQINIAKQKIEAEKQGIITKDKDPQKIAAESFRKRILSNLGKVTTGVSPQFSKSPQTFGNLDEGSQKIITDAAGVLPVLDEKTLRDELKKKGVKNIKGKDIENAGFFDLQDKYVQLFLESLRSQLDLPKQPLFLKPAKLNYGNKETEKLFNAALIFAGGKPESQKVPLRPEEKSTLSETKSQADLLFGEKNLILGIASAREDELKIVQQIGEISAKKNAQLDGEIKRLEFQRKAQQENLSLAKEYFDTFEKEAKTNDPGGEISKQNKDAALKILNESTGLSGKEFENKILEIRKSLTGIDGNSTELTNEISTRIKLLEQERGINKSRLDAEIKVNSLVVDGNEAIKERNRLLELNRDLSQSQFNLRDAQRQKDLSILQTRAGGVNTPSSERRRLQAQETPIKLADIQDQREQALKIQKQSIEDATKEASLRGISGLQKYQDPTFIRSFDKANLEFEKTAINLDRATAELNAFNSQLDEIETSSTSFANAIDAFERGRGSARGQNQFNNLQATDPSSIVGGLIGEQVYGQAEGKSGANAVSFIAEQNALLNEQFKINTAANASEKFELENQLELTKAILDIKNQNLDPAEKQLKIEEAINANLEKRRSFSFGVGQAVSGIQTEVQTFGSDFGKTATNGFRDGLVGAMQAAVSQTDNLRDALLDVALTFANKLRDAALNNLANIITSGLFKPKDAAGGGGGIVSGIVGAIGGLFGKKATGGLITGGSGSKDDVPTLLMGGEYVVNKKAVNAYGRNFFESLNNGSVGQMAQGGYFTPGTRGQGTISGKENLLDFATQTATTGKGDVVSSLGAGAGLVSLEPESLRLSNFGRFGDSPIVQATQEAKEQAFGLYLDQLGAEKDYQNQLDQIKKAEKAKKKQLLMSLAVAAVSAGLSYGAGKLNFGKTIPKALNANLPAALNKSTGLYQSVGGSLAKGISSSFLNFGVPFRNASPFSGGQSLSGSNMLNSLSDTAGIYSGYSNERMINRSPFADVGGGNPLFNGINVNGRRYNSGGSVSGSGDTVPAMLSNKEFVLNSSAAQKIGDKGLYALNNGANPSGGDSEARIVSKLDELIEKTVGASNITISVSMGSEGGDKTDNSQQGDSNTNEKQRFLIQRLKETVIGVIRDEQRPGGLLTSTKR